MYFSRVEYFKYVNYARLNCPEADNVPPEGTLSHVNSGYQRLKFSITQADSTGLLRIRQRSASPKAMTTVQASPNTSTSQMLVP